MEMRLLLVLLVLLSGCASQPRFFESAGKAPEPAPITIERWPHGELWAGVIFNGQKIGFSRRVVRRAAAGEWEIESEAMMRLQFLSVDKRIGLRGVDRVGADLTLREFEYEHDIDGNRMLVTGAVDGDVLRFTVNARGSSEAREIKLQGPVYPTSALGFLPVAHGLKVGSARSYAVFYGEAQQVAQADVRIQAYEASSLYEGSAFRVETRLLGLDTTTWIAPDGRPLFERSMQGVLISALEDEAVARRYLVEASLNKRDAMVDFTLVKAGPIPAPRRVSRMDIVFTNDMAVPSDGGQRCTREPQKVSCTIDRSAPLAQDDPKRYLKATFAAPSNLRDISELARAIAADAKDDDERIARLIAWMDANIAKEAVDAFTAEDVLRARKGECQGHSYLFAAFARSVGMPARIVNGIVYSEEHGGFLYHTWNEAWVAGRGWQPLDATFGQAHADATHVKLLEGETGAELMPIVRLVGRVRVGAVTAHERW
jgi:hypothetical protein